VFAGSTQNTRSRVTSGLYDAVRGKFRRDLLSFYFFGCKKEIDRHMVRDGVNGSIVGKNFKKHVFSI
jgi:hypothetical protein